MICDGCDFCPCVHVPIVSIVSIVFLMILVVLVPLCRAIRHPRAYMIAYLFVVQIASSMQWLSNYVHSDTQQHQVLHSLHISEL